jgi:hypothetical protein
MSIYRQIERWNPHLAGSAPPDRRSQSPIERYHELRRHLDRLEAHDQPLPRDLIMLERRLLSQAKGAHYRQ